MGKFWGHAPGNDDLAALGERTLRQLPPPFSDLIEGVVIRVQDFAEDEVLRDLDIDSPYDLLGLYQGRPIGFEEDGAQPHDVTHIALYRGALLSYWVDENVTLEALVRHVLIHEIGHHFGLSDDDMERIEQRAEEA